MKNPHPLVRLRYVQKDCGQIDQLHQFIKVQVLGTARDADFESWKSHGWHIEKFQNQRSSICDS